MNKIIIYSGIYLLGVVVSAVAQILLKKSADIPRESKIKEYLNIKTILAYGVFFFATFCTVFSYRYVPLSMGPILGTTEYIFIAILSYWFLKEKITKKKFLGLIAILIGVTVYFI